MNAFLDTWLLRYLFFQIAYTDRFVIVIVSLVTREDLMAVELVHVVSFSYNTAFPVNTACLLWTIYESGSIYPIMNQFDPIMSKSLTQQIYTWLGHSLSCVLYERSKDSFLWRTSSFLTLRELNLIDRLWSLHILNSEKGVHFAASVSKFWAAVLKVLLLRTRELEHACFLDA